MADSKRKLAVSAPAMSVEPCASDGDWVCCLHCGGRLGLVQPEKAEPERLVGTCEGFRRWYLIDWRPGSREGVMLLLPEHEELLLLYVSHVGQDAVRGAIGSLQQSATPTPCPASTEKSARTVRRTSGILPGR